MTPDPDLVAALMQSVLPVGLGVAARDPRLMPSITMPREVADVQGAVPRRMAEFHAGRAAARAAMVALSLPPRPIPMGPDRAPIWPDGVVGSISHSADACVAVIGLCSEWAGLGVDLEPATGLETDSIDTVCTQSEQRWLAKQPAGERGLMAKLIFCAKEAAFKAQYPLSRSMFGFDALEVGIDREDSRFEARFVQAQGPIKAGTLLAGSYAHAAGLLVTGAAIRQSEAVQITLA